jgi:hypothetical protein
MRLALSLPVAAAVFGIDPRAGRSAPQTAVAAIPQAGYQVVHGWPVLPDGFLFDEVSSVAVDSRGQVFVLQRGGRQWPDSDVLDQTPIPVPTVFVFDGRTGRPINSWGSARFALPHSVTVDRQDNVWITDVAVGAGGELYVADFSGRRVQKFLRGKE